MNKAIKKSAAFQFSQGLGQHFPRNIWDGTLEFVETSRPRLGQNKTIGVQVSAMTLNTCRAGTAARKGVGHRLIRAPFSLFKVTKWYLLVKWLPSR